MILMHYISNHNHLFQQLYYCYSIPFPSTIIFVNFCNELQILMRFKPIQVISWLHRDHLFISYSFSFIIHFLGTCWSIIPFIFEKIITIIVTFNSIIFIFSILVQVILFLFHTFYDCFQFANSRNRFIIYSSQLFFTFIIEFYYFYSIFQFIFNFYFSVSLQSN